MNGKRNLITKHCFIYLIAFLVGISVTLYHSTPHAEETSATYDDVLAGFIINMLSFVEWPEGSFPEKNSPIKVAVLNRQDLYLSMADMVENKRGKQKIEIRKVSDTKGLEKFNVVFISHENLKGASAIIKRLTHRPTLIVGDMKGFAETGGMINFYLNKGRVRFEINPVASKKAGLKISSELLKLARIAGER